MQRGMLFKTGPDYYVCMGRSPSVVHVTYPKFQLYMQSVCSIIIRQHVEALKLNEIAYKFKGPLPEHEIDENQISCKEEATRKRKDALEEGDESNALCLQPGRTLGCTNKLKIAEETLFLLIRLMSKPPRFISGACFDKSSCVSKRPGQEHI